MSDVGEIILGSTNRDKDEPDHEDYFKKRSLQDFGLVGKAELSGLTISTTIGLFAILAIINTEPPYVTKIILSVGYFIVVALGIWLFGNHQMYSSVSEKYLGKIDPDYLERIAEAVEPNWFARTTFRLSHRLPLKRNLDELKGKYDTTPHQKHRNTIFVTLYLATLIILWIAVFFRIS